MDPCGDFPSPASKMRARVGAEFLQIEAVDLLRLGVLKLNEPRFRPQAVDFCRTLEKHQSVTQEAETPWSRLNALSWSKEAISFALDPN